MEPGPYTRDLEEALEPERWAQDEHNLEGVKVTTWEILGALEIQRGVTPSIPGVPPEYLAPARIL